MKNTVIICILIQFYFSNALAMVFIPKYKDSYGREWSQHMGHYGNGCSSSTYNSMGKLTCPYVYMFNNPVVDPNDSEAEKVCRALGPKVRLPTRGDYYRLVWDFGYYSANDPCPSCVHSTPSRFQAMQAKFGDMTVEAYWQADIYVSSLGDYKSNNALVLRFADYKGSLVPLVEFSTGPARSRLEKLAVRCIRDP